MLGSINFLAKLIEENEWSFTVKKCIYYCWDCWLWETQIHALTKLHLHQKGRGCKDLGLCRVCSHSLAQGWTEIIQFLSQLILVSSHHQVSGHLSWNLAEMGVTSHVEKVDKMPSLLVLKVWPVRQCWTLYDWFSPEMLNITLVS